jgi:hypothetical protein
VVQRRAAILRCPSGRLATFPGVTAQRACVRHSLGPHFRVTSIDGLTTFELVQRALSAAYGLRGLLGSGNAYRVSRVVVGWTLLGVRLLGGLLSDVARGLSCRVPTLWSAWAARDMLGEMSRAIDTLLPTADPGTSNADGVQVEPHHPRWSSKNTVDTASLTTSRIGRLPPANPRPPADDHGPNLILICHRSARPHPAD